jgi:hypothetical protein
VNMILDTHPVETASSNRSIEQDSAAKSVPRTSQRTIQNIQVKDRSISKKPRAKLDVSKFRVLKSASQMKALPRNMMAREGFEDAELYLPPRFITKRSTRQSRHPLCSRSLTLVTAFAIQDLPSTLHHENELGGTLEKFELEPKNDRERRKLHILKAPKVLRRVSFVDEVYNQLVNVTAPTRSISESYAEERSESESGSEASELMDNWKLDEINVTPSPGKVAGIRDLADGIEENEFQTEKKQEKPQTDIIEDDHTLFEDDETERRVSEEYLNCPGQVMKMKSSGQWIEVREDIIDVDDPRASNIISMNRATQNALPSMPLGSISKSAETHFFYVWILLSFWIRYIVP